MSVKDTKDRLIETIRIQTDIAKLGMDLGAIMALVTERAQTMTSAHGAVLELAEGDDMVYRAATGIAAAQLGMRVKQSASLSGRSVREQSTLRCHDSETDPRVNREACRQVGLRSMVVVPLMHAGTAIGVLKVMSKERGAFADVDAETLGLSSELIAAAMFHATQHDQSELFHRATHDALTGLANRALFYDRLRQAISQAQRAGGCVAVMNLDMDGLKPINDEYGHRAGDAAIQEVAKRLAEGTRETDTVARMGGDEFALVLAPVDGHEGAHQLCERISERIACRFVFEQNELPLGASVGFSLFPDDGHDIEALVEKADKAMYAVKRSRTSHRRRV